MGGGGRIFDRTSLRTRVRTDGVTRLQESSLVDASCARAANN